MSGLNSEPRFILATDVGSTTTKARFFGKVNGEWKFLASGEAPTTVEKPVEDVTKGVRNAVKEVEELTGHKIIDYSTEELKFIMPYRGNKTGIDVYVSTSSAGGGLQMLVMGVVKSITAESAQRAALGAGAIVMDVIAVDDGRETHEKVNIVRFLRPDMVLLAGGTDGGDKTHVLEMAEVLAVAKPKPRFGVSYRLPVIYAGNKNAREDIKRILSSDFFDVRVVDNIRPQIEVERVEPARNAILELFMEHVMAHAPGYEKLMKLTSTDIMPTPAAEGLMIRTFAEMKGVNVLGVGMGGATTNVYSVFDGRFLRTVSANLGMSYSIGNVFKEAGIDNVRRWIPFDMTDEDIMSIVYNKMIRPTTIPMTLEDLVVEHAIARESIRMAFNHHKYLARELKGVKKERTISDIFEEVKAEETYIDMMRVNYIIGTGGLLSRAPRRAQSMIILIDAFQPIGFTYVMQDSVFMIPHLGVLSKLYKEIALEIFEKECLVPLGTVVAGKGFDALGEKVADVELTFDDGREENVVLRFGEIVRISIPYNVEVEVSVKPSRNFDFGAGAGKPVSRKVRGGVVGLVLDGRGRPIYLPASDKERRKLVLGWFKSMDLYPHQLMNRVEV
ncbi:MAG: methylaspartate mutase [Zestosphaera tikiterensis]|uniref:Methylaspartate mutase n=1 Tax=Zestosphaera tikiterensis TaxID=1973259 RepID=A0A2R7Y9X1_9CREN|nr:MAG: methylaspartate mutase [Zestosphaera tikiterensis]